MQRKNPLRRRANLENRLWARLREMEGYRFRRRSPFRTFTLDFVEHDTRLVVVLEDGAPGRRAQKSGLGHIVRDRLLSEQGYVILRLWRAEAERDLGATLVRIKSVLEDIAPAL
jgi:very-short-patch-repair endonuclease